MTDPADDLWSLLLAAARARRSAALPATVPGLAHSAALGWQLPGAWEPAALALFALFKPLLDGHAAGLPDRPVEPSRAGAAGGHGEVDAGTPAWVIGQLGQSLDGCVATRDGDSRFISGPETLVHLHRLRALSDAVIVGAGTVASDNPRLTTRHVPGPHPVRVLLDPGLRLSALVGTAHVFNDCQAPTLWLCDAIYRQQALALVEAKAGAVQVLAVAGLRGGVDGAGGGELRLERAVAALQARGLRRLFVEGGGVTVSRFLARHCLDRLHLSVAPLLIGDGRPGLRFPGAARLADCARPACSIYPMGRDQLWDLDLRRCG